MATKRHEKPQKETHPKRQLAQHPPSSLFPSRALLPFRGYRDISCFQSTDPEAPLAMNGTSQRNKTPNAYGDKGR